MKQIGENIRDLRKKEQITQEKLAEYLGVSFQSISRWENGLAYPDVTLIPAIARYFKVSTDALFNMEDEKSTQRQDYFNNAYTEYRRNGNLEEQKSLMETAVKEFPRNYHYMVNLAFRKDYGFADKLTADEKIQYVQSANYLYKIMMPDGNYQYYHHIMAWNHRRLAELYLLQEKREETFTQLLLAEKEAIAYDNPINFHYTAPLVNTLEYDPNSHSKSWEGSEQGMLLYRLWELKRYFENHDGYAQLIKRLQTATKEQAPIQIE